MKVVIFIPSLTTGGAERVTATLASHWVRAGWEVTVVTLSPAAEDRYGLDPRVRRVALGLVGESAGFWSGLRANLRRLGALRAAIRAERPAAVIAMMGTPSVLLAVAALGLRGTLRVGTERIHPPRLPLGRVWELLRAVTYRALDVIVVQTDATAAWVRTHTFARRVVVIPNPAPWPLPVAPPVRAPGSVGVAGRRRILGAGRLDPQKGFDLLLEAFARVAPRIPDLELVLLGEGRERAALEALAQRLGVGDRVVLAGEVGNPGEWYAATELFVLSSRFEGFPNALVEAMSSGCAVVATDCDVGPAEIVTPEVDGLLVPPGDVAALAAALARALGDEPLRRRLGAAAIRVRERLALPAIHGKWAELLEPRHREAA